MCTKLGGGVLGQGETEFGNVSFPQNIKVGIVLACMLPTVICAMPCSLDFNTSTGASGHPEVSPVVCKNLLIF